MQVVLPRRVRLHPPPAQASSTAPTSSQHIAETYRPDQVWYADDVFTINHRWLYDYAAELKRRGLRLPFETISRADRMMKDEVLETLAEMGCYRIWIGSESGSQRILDAMQRGVTVEQVQWATQAAQRHGIEVGMFLMWGYDGETLEDIEATIEHVKKSNPDMFLTTVAYPIKNTPYFDKIADTLGARQGLDHGHRPRLRDRAAATRGPTTSTPTAGCAARWRPSAWPRPIRPEAAEQAGRGRGGPRGPPGDGRRARRTRLMHGGGDDRGRFRRPWPPTTTAVFTESRLGELLRQAVWRRLDDVFRPGDRVLELDCGTGEDAVHLARRGVRVLATDGPGHGRPRRPRRPGPPGGRAGGDGGPGHRARWPAREAASRPATRRPVRRSTACSRTSGA